MPSFGHPPAVRQVQTPGQDGGVHLRLRVGGVKAWQCLLSHALTFRPSPQARLPQWGVGGASGQVPAVL